MKGALLARKDVKINIGDTWCDSLATAMTENDWRMVQLLLQHSAKLCPAATPKPTLWMGAVSSDGTNAITILLRHGHVRNPYSANGENQRAKLLAAAFHQGNE